MFNCLKNRTPVIIPPRAEPEILGDSDKVFFIIIGHNRSARGATNYLGESEYPFNKRIGHKLQARLGENGLKSFVILRPSGRYSSQVRSVVKDVKKIMREENLESALGYCLHFNDAQQSARGCEGLVTGRNDLEAIRLVDNVTDLLNERLSIRERHNDGVNKVKDNHNGALMINALEDIGVGAPIIECCFAGYRTKESEAIFENEDRYVDILKDAVLMTLRP